MITYEAIYMVNVTVDKESDLTKVEDALEAAAKSIGTEVNVVEDDVTENDDESED